ncbi:MAG: hypothetical protein LBI31_07520 [Zoogloeaceae bacterium]|jgi:hypothetical protein|nr:hypothetical protein [Zoogloeaceae bacterium]
MARLKTQARPAAVNQAADNAQDTDDLAVLFPDVEAVINGEQVTIRELRFGEQIRHAAALARVYAAVKPVFGDESGDIGAIIDALAGCQDDIVTLTLASTGKDRAWFDALPAAQGEALLALFWSANRGFFLRRLLDYPAMRLKAEIPAGAASSPPSSGTDTGQAT